MQITRVAKAKVTARAPDISQVSPVVTAQSINSFNPLPAHVVRVDTIRLFTEVVVKLDSSKMAASFLKLNENHIN